MAQIDSSIKRRLVWVDICYGVDILSAIRGSRRPDYMTVEQRPASTFRFRFRLNEEGHDDSTQKSFDWWLERLTTMAKTAQEHGGAGPEISVFERSYENGIYCQNRWTGLLGKDASNFPGTIGEDLFQFELNAVAFSHTWATEESLPAAGRWANRLQEEEEEEETGEEEEEREYRYNLDQRRQIGF